MDKQCIFYCTKKDYTNETNSKYAVPILCGFIFVGFGSQHFIMEDLLVSEQNRVLDFNSIVLTMKQTYILLRKVVFIGGSAIVKFSIR